MMSFLKMLHLFLCLRIMSSKKDVHLFPGCFTSSLPVHVIFFYYSSCTLLLPLHLILMSLHLFHFLWYSYSRMNNEGNEREKGCKRVTSFTSSCFRDEFSSAGHSLQSYHVIFTGSRIQKNNNLQETNTRTAFFILQEMLSRETFAILMTGRLDMR